MFSFLRRRSDNYTNADQQLVFQLSKSRIPSPRQLKYIGHFIKGRERTLLGVSALLCVMGFILLALTFYRNHIELIPENGGRYTEGMVGNPQYINPLYSSFNTVDADLERLIFSRLFTIDTNGQTIPDLASGFIISDDQKTYTVYLREAHWTDGSSITADDILFTFKLIQDPNFRSPLRTRFTGITVDKRDDQTVIFTLKEPYGKFTSLLDFGILPSNLWDGVSPDMIPLAELNLKPVGSGPYQLKSLLKNNIGTVRSYTLERNPLYYGKAPYLDEIVFKFFPSPEEMINALNKGQLNGLAELPADQKDTIIAKNSLNYQASVQPQLTALFFNLASKTVVAEKPIRQALSALSIQELITATSSENSTPADSILMPGQPGYSPQSSVNLEESRKILDDNGWKMRTITDTDVTNAKAAKNAKDAGNIATIGTGEWSMKDNQGLIITLTAPTALKDMAEKIAENWKKLGIKINLAIQSDETIQAQVLGNKDFQVLLYTEALENGDPYPFWTTGAPGNFTSYSNKEVDIWLTEARLTADTQAAAERYQKFQTAIHNDIPVVPLYWQTYIYPQTKKLKGQKITLLRTPSDRLAGIGEWYFNVKRRFK